MAPAGIGDRVEGFHAVAAAVAAGRVDRLIVEKSRLRTAEVAALVDSAGSSAEVELVEDVRPLAQTSAPQGVVATARPIPVATLRDVAEACRPAWVVVLDHLEDPGNVGAIARSARAAGAGGLVVGSRRAAPLGPMAFKAAAGALESLPVAVISSIADGLATLSDLGVWSVGLIGTAPTSLFGLELLSEPVALVVGAEGRGLARLVVDRCDVLARIPLSGGVESLNASVAAALAVFETARVRQLL